MQIYNQYDEVLSKA